MAACPICLHSQSTDFYQKDGRLLLICEACRHIWWESFPSPQQLAEYYQQTYTPTHQQDSLQEGHRAYYAGHAADLCRLLNRSPRKISIVDYGCSYPVFLEEAAKLPVRRAIGIDYSAQAFAASPVEMRTPDELHLIQDSSIDIVRFSHTLEHTIDPVATLGSMVSKLRWKALVYITQPNFPIFAFGSSDTDLKDSVYPEHLHFFSMLSLIRLTERCGLKLARAFSHQNELDVQRRYASILDPKYAHHQMAVYASYGDKHHPLGSYPHYAGENSCLYAWKQ